MRHIEGYIVLKNEPDDDLRAPNTLLLEDVEDWVMVFRRYEGKSGLNIRFNLCGPLRSIYNNRRERRVPQKC